ncbi:MAG: PDZ domain-containing protein [Faecousia sp.]
MEQPKNGENHEEAQERPCYYGTGRRRELDKSRLPLVLSLLAVVLAANLLTITLHVRQNYADAAQTSQDETENAASDAYPVRSPKQTSGEDESSSFGMELSALDDAERRYWELPEGLIVQSVDADSIAAKAGILPGDILLAVDGATVKEPHDYFTAVEAAAPGEKLCLTVYRCGAYYVLELTIPVKEQTLHREA